MAQTTPSEVAGTKGETPFAVLVADGNEEHQILSVAALTRQGCLVRTAASGKQALHLAMTQRFDALVIGSKLRDATGIEVLHLLAERFPEIPKIFVVPPDGEEAALQAIAHPGPKPRPNGNQQRQVLTWLKCAPIEFGFTTELAQEPWGWWAEFQDLDGNGFGLWAPPT